MPVSTIPQWMLEDLDRAGYRPITIASYGDFIGGCRYVSIETGSGVRLQGVTQFTPCDTRSAWAVWKWEDLGAVYQGSQSRSSLADLPVYGEWFGSVPEKVSGNVYSGIVRQGESVGMPFSQFISACVGGYENPFEVTGAFNARHPIDTVERAKADLRRVQAELEAREARVKQDEAFREVNTLKMVASELDRAGDDRGARRVRDQAEALRRDVQARLDAEAQENRRYRPQTRSILESNPGQEYQWTGWRNRAEENRQAREEANALREKLRAPAKPKLEIAQPSNKRSFLSDDEV